MRVDKSFVGHAKQSPYLIVMTLDILGPMNIRVICQDDHLWLLIDYSGVRLGLFALFRWDLLPHDRILDHPIAMNNYGINL